MLVSHRPSRPRAGGFYVRRTSVTAEITATAGAQGNNPSRFDFNNE